MFPDFTACRQEWRTEHVTFGQMSKTERQHSPYISIARLLSVDLEVLALFVTEPSLFLGVAECAGEHCSQYTRISSTTPFVNLV